MTGVPIRSKWSGYVVAPPDLYLGPLDRALAGVARPPGPGAQPGQPEPARTESGGYLRYMDDFLLFGRTKEELHRSRAGAARVLGDELCLRLKEPGTFIAPVAAGVPFLGLRIFPGTIRLDDSSNRNSNTLFSPASSPPGQKASVHGRPSRASAATRAAVPRPSEGPNSPAAPVAPRRGRGGPFQPFLARYRRFPPACPCNDQQALADHFNLS